MSFHEIRKDALDPVESPFDVVALVTSAGGLEALSAVLRPLPAHFPASVVVVQHLPPSGSQLGSILERRTLLPVQWAVQDMAIQPREVIVSPARQLLIIQPDHTVELQPNEGGILDYPIDAFLTSLAESYGKRALAVVMTGMGSDGAIGVRALKAAGGTIIAQSEETAEYASMPHAAIATGAVDYILPLHEIGTVLVRVIVEGKPFPRPRHELEAIQKLFAGESETARLMRETDWNQTPLGSVTEWPENLRVLVRLMLDSPLAITLTWGPSFVQLFNEAYRSSLGQYQSQALGQPIPETFPEQWQVIEPVYRSDISSLTQSLPFAVNRTGSPEEAYFTFAQAPIRENGHIQGVLTVVLETTRSVIAERRLVTLNDVQTRIAGATSVQDLCDHAIRALAASTLDIPFALMYLLNGSHTRATLKSVSGLKSGTAPAPSMIELNLGQSAWPLATLIQTGQPLLMQDLQLHFPALMVGPWPEPPKQALLIPLRDTLEDVTTAVLILGISPQQAFDIDYRTFFDLIAAQITAHLIDIQSREREQERRDALEDANRVKTEFYSNISHEFRTPLTLLLSPLEKALNARHLLPETVAADLEIAQRSGLRLLRLVNTLLDFSQIETRRMKAHFELTDLATFTLDLVTLFRPAAERAGLDVIVDIPPLDEPVSVDRGMWEKIVSHMLSNALKFTFRGSIRVSLHALPMHTELIVQDSGVGIPEADLPHLFERFHRIPGTARRTHEGTGIGLALVNELVRLHNGRIRVRSRVGAGTTFTVWIPNLARASTVSDSGTRSQTATISMESQLFAAEAERWVAEASREPQQTLDELLTPMRPILPGSCILVVEENADLRDYMSRLLSTHWQVETASNGVEALASAINQQPDLILADAMVPEMDGFALLRHIRQDERLKDLPIVLLTAREGEEQAIEGLIAGADDYIVKPFSARELIARVGAQLELARIRRENRTALEEQEERLRLALSAASMGVWEIDVETEKALRSERYYQIFGYSQDETSASLNDFFERVHPEELDRVTEAVNNAIHHQRPYSVEFRIVQPNGAVRWVHSEGRSYTNGSPESARLIGVVYDITARKQADTALRESEERFRTLVQNIHDYAIFQLDANLIVTQWPEGAQRVKGYTPAEAIGQHISIFFTPEELAEGKLEEEFGQAAAEGRAEREDWRVRKGGERFWGNEIVTALYNEAGQLTGFTKISRDLTERMLAEEALRISEERLRLIIDSARLRHLYA